MATTRFGISLEDALLDRFDALIRNKGYANRSEAIRDLIRDSLVAEEWRGVGAETVGTITIVYSPEKKELADILTDLQHHHHHAIISSMHIHLDAHHCIEVIVVRGRAHAISTIADRLIGTKGQARKAYPDNNRKTPKVIFFAAMVSIMCLPVKTG